jgi:hypothetical protein
MVINISFTCFWYTILKDEFKNTNMYVKYLISIYEKQSLFFKIKILNIDFEIVDIEAKVFPTV